MKQIETKTGAEIQIAPAPFKDAMELKNVLFKELASSGISFDKINLEDIEKTGLEQIIKPIIQIDTSKDFYNAFFKCAGRCLYNGNKITEETFEDVTAREDYYLIMLEVLKENLSPFFKGLVSKLSLFTAKTAKTKEKNQKS
jgi:hypothetical protein